MLILVTLIMLYLYVPAAAKLKVLRIGSAGKMDLRFNLCESNQTKWGVISEWNTFGRSRFEI